MTNNKANKSKILTLILELAMCLALMLGIVFANPTFAVYAAGEDGTAPTIIRTGGIDVDRVNRMGNLPAAIKGKEYKADDGSNYKIEVTGTAPVTFSIPLSYLPKGLSLNETTGEIVGTPTEAGNFTVTIYVENAYGSDNVLVSLRVYDEESKPKITTTQTDIAVGYVNSSYLQKIDYVEGTGYPPEAIIIGNLPTGLRLQPSGYAFYIEGTPTVADTFAFTVRMKNAAGFDEKQYTITIKNEIVAPKIQMEMTVINDSYSKVNDRGNLEIIKGKEIDVQFYATGTNTSDNPIKWSCDTSVLPAGLNLSESGHLTGTVAESVELSLGSKYFFIELTATNINGSGAEQGDTSSKALIVCENGKIAGITTISPENTSVPKGGQRQFTATVIGYGDFDDSVTWTVYYNSSKDTKISQDGVLTVGIDETATKIGVEATCKNGSLYEIPVTIIDHMHSISLVPATPETCTTDGNKEHFKCNVCGDLFADAGGVNSLTEEDVKKPAGHDYTQMVGLVSPTCSSKGMKAHFRCHNCDKYFELGSYAEVSAESLEIDIDPNAHNTTHKDGSEANCSVTGIYPHEHCSLCNKNFYSDGVTEMTDIVKPKNDNHDWNAWVSNGNGTHTRTCKRDSGHKENGTYSGGTATCTIKAVCEVCRTTYGDTAPHDFDTLIPEVPATTEDFGVKEHKDCKVCGKHFDKDGNEITELKIAKIGTHNVVINGESNFYKEGESVTVTANDPAEGKVFKGWKDESGEIVSTEKSYTFKVSGATTLTAVYEDTPVAKKGLSGGAIAGIVIGSVLLAGIGGFAIFWFAVKKKTFADLGVALKKGFTAMGNGIKTACRAIGNFFKTLGAKIKALFTKKK